MAKETVYPMFDRLGSLHGSLREELRLLVVRQRLFEHAVGMLGGFVSMLPALAKGKGRAAKSANPLAACLAGPSAEERAAQALEESTLQVGRPA